MRVKCFPKPDFEEFLVQVAYGKDYLNGCIGFAYLDFCRTMHGFGKLPNKDSIYSRASTKVRNAVNAIVSTPPQTQLEFDKWHRNLSEALIGIFRNTTFDFHAGQAQKWINMTLKNIFVCGEKRLSVFQPTYEFCHMPIDNVVLRQLPKEILTPAEPWSRWSYEEYSQFQRKLWEWYGGQPLLNVEHELWIDGQ
jgi:hypothetical protein